MQRKDEDDDDEEDEALGKDLYASSNLLGYVSRNIANLYLGRNPYSLSHIQPNPVYIDTLEKFDRFFEKLEAAPIVAVDTETKNLSATKNSIFIIQFAFSNKKGYVLPLFHPMTPFTASELQYIQGKLRAWFIARPPEHFKYLVTLNGMYDLKVIRAQFKIPIILRRVWEVTGGESCLDENVRVLEDFQTPIGGLRGLFTHYGNELYWTMPMSKDERETIGFVSPDNKDLQDYAALDVQSILGIREMQIERSRALQLGSRKYTPFYTRLVSNQLSNTAHVISHMVGRGVNLDMVYLTHLRSKSSPLLTELDEVRKELYSMPSVKATNKALLKAEGGSTASGGLFGRQAWVFKETKPDHKIALFIETLGLEPRSYTKTKQPQIDKAFQKYYKDEVTEVRLFERIQKITKIWGTYVNGFYKTLRTSLDGWDNRLRAGYGFWKVVTGRLNSFKPSLQQIPTRDPISKYIKRCFVAPYGHLYVKFDYSAHEVRFWAIMAKDDVLAGVFRIGQTLRKKFRRNPTPELKKKIKEKGDIHILNILFFFNMLVDKSHPLREAIKSVIFGVIYGKSAGTLAKDVGGQRIGTLEDGLKANKKEIAALDVSDKAKRKELQEKRETLKEELEEARNKDWKTFAADLMSKLFARFSKGGEWLTWASAFAEENFYVYSPTGRRRNLYGVLTGIKSVISAMGRRAKNSPIQGTASEVAVTSARLIAIAFYEFLLEWYPKTAAKMEVLPAEPLKAVHDALYSECPYKYILPYVHIVQWVATYGVTEYYKETFDFEFNIEPEIEMEFGATESQMFKWDWSHGNLEECIKSALASAKEIGTLKGTEEEAFDTIMAPYKNEEMKVWLDTRYPILGVQA
jgi:DNA polymerase I-like protein with 3'-5' exonuclease and polymerase domains